MRVLDVNGTTWFDPILRPLERITYRLMGCEGRQGAGLETIHAGHSPF